MKKQPWYDRGIFEVLELSDIMAIAILIIVATLLLASGATP